MSKETTQPTETQPEHTWAGFPLKDFTLPNLFSFYENQEIRVDVLSNGTIVFMSNEDNDGHPQQLAFIKPNLFMMLIGLEILPQDAQGDHDLIVADTLMQLKEIRRMKRNEPNEPGGLYGLTVKILAALGFQTRG